MSDQSGPSQRWDAKGYAENARFVADLGMPVVALLDPQPGERILDLGCGDGALTAKLATAGRAVVGVDASPELVAAARARGLDVHLMDGHALDAGTGFDAVFSNAALHWMLRPDEVIAGVWKALRHGGRFVGEFGGAGNVATIVTALEAALDRRGFDAKALNPWFFPTPEDYALRLAAAGFQVRSCELVDRPTPLPTGMAGWLATFAGSFVQGLRESDRAAVLEEVMAAIAPTLLKPDGTWYADYVRLRFAADKPDALGPDA
ncbi:trans-aconitate methyltransferase [Skermanella stibiiresistens SB22]|uniref:Trans-aconitate methyltransferase n=1 Tax=Skermanella stibiiresistens SB22 TaxID=1385369 RepID=W9H5S7_9PROT|nr:class I SAM-dependent methyltransferase [Skermanella stibiiresistens]EWY40116.1 trans-aconitate methyltransferase [Skermanella stibiiresistens SB22]